MRKRDRNCLACSPIDAPETAVLIAIRSINIHQYDSGYFLVPHVPSSLPLAEHICTAHHIEVILPTDTVLYYKTLFRTQPHKRIPVPFFLKTYFLLKLKPL